MELLLDTNVLLFGMSDDPRLGAEARRMISSPANRCHFSAASVWEVVIKHDKRPDVMPIDGDRFMSACLLSGADELPVLSRHTLLVPGLAQGSATGHKDPFDRLLLAQAKSEGMLLLTCDALLLGYGEPFLVDARL